MGLQRCLFEFITPLSCFLDIKISRLYNWFALWTCNPFLVSLMSKINITLFQCVQITPINSCQLSVPNSAVLYHVVAFLQRQYNIPFTHMQITSVTIVLIPSSQLRKESALWYFFNGFWEAQKLYLDTRQCSRTRSLWPQLLKYHWQKLLSRIDSITLYNNIIQVVSALMKAPAPKF